MIQAATKTTVALEANTALQEVLEGRYYWELAPDATKGQYVTFRVLENPRVTKNARRSYEVTHWCFAETLTQAAELSELVTDALLEDGQYYLGSESGYVDDDTKEGFIKLIFKFNI